LPRPLPGVEAFSFLAFPPGSRALRYFAEVGYSLEMPDTTRFDCPNCGAEYKVIRAEADPPPDRRLNAADAALLSKAVTVSSSSNTSSWAVQGPKAKRRVSEVNAWPPSFSSLIFVKPIGGRRR
jgi:hypothetical protein